MVKSVRLWLRSMMLSMRILPCTSLMVMLTVVKEEDDSGMSMRMMEELYGVGVGAHLEVALGQDVADHVHHLLDVEPYDDLLDVEPYDGSPKHMAMMIGRLVMMAQTQKQLQRRQMFAGINYVCSLILIFTSKIKSIIRGFSKGLHHGANRR